MRRGKRYAIQGSRWKSKELSYKIKKYPRGLSKEQVDKTIERAFKIWEKATPLKFNKKKSGAVDIEISFESGRHGDEDPFDGPGGTLGHAFFPMFGGDIHLDADEDWSVNSTRGTNLLQTVAHEIGHSLGLAHSNDRNSLMAPFYRGYDPDLMLEEDDIRGIQALYGENPDSREDDTSSRNPTTSRPPPRKDDKPICQVDHIDTIVTLPDLFTYVFIGNQYWKLIPPLVSPGYPRSISRDWAGLPGNLDASLVWRNGKILFFKGSKYWRFSGVGKLDAGYPKEISEGFLGIPNNLDAAYVRDGKIYFFKGSYFWTFNTKRNISQRHRISTMTGVPDNLDGALQYSNGRTYFFKDGVYYRLDVNTFSVESASPRFPRETSVWWFGCSSTASRLTNKSWGWK